MQRNISGKKTAVVMLSLLFIFLMPGMTGQVKAGVTKAGMLDVLISIEKPSGWLSTQADVIVKVELVNTSITVFKVEAKINKDGIWQDITQVRIISVRENCTIFVQVTDGSGNIYIKSSLIECIDNIPPELNVYLIGDTLHSEAYDAQSGIASIYINGHIFNTPVNGVLDIAISEYIELYSESIDVQAQDFAGNRSPVYYLENPFYQEETQLSDEAYNSPVIPVDGNGSVLENNVKYEGEREFYTIETKNGGIFYLVIDKQKSSANVYLLVEADERNLTGFVDVEDTVSSVSKSGIGHAAEPTPTPEPTPLPTPVTTERPPEELQTKTKSGGIGNIVFIVIALIGGGGAYFYLNVYLPNKKQEQEDEPEDYDEEEDESEKTMIDDESEDSEDDDDV